MPRRVLGSLESDNVDNSITMESPTSLGPEVDDIKCPICEEPMINVFQLNQHVDDIHVNIPTTPSKLPISASVDSKQSPLNIDRNLTNDIKTWFKDSTPVKRKALNLDLFEGNNKGFSLSDESSKPNIQQDKSETSSLSQGATSPLNKPKITRGHWKRPINNTTCKLCDKPLNVKNGIVNCRRCGELFCNEHTNYKVKLRNPISPPNSLPEYSPQGIWSKCCETCFLNKPDIVKGTDPNILDLSEEFKRVRRNKVEESQLNRDRSIKRYIKLVNFLSEYHFTKKPELSLSTIFQTNNDDIITNKEKEIVGYENWQDDTKIHNCNICFSKFNLLIRKHHCRICGRIVCDDRFQERRDCSLMVPISIIMTMLPTLNYSKFVQSRFNDIISTDSIQIRLCKSCKDSILYGYKLKTNQTVNGILDEIFQSYYQLSAIKNNINHLLPKYESLLLSADFNLTDTNRLKNKIMSYLKDYEKLIYQFKAQFYDHDNISIKYEKYEKLINGINQSLILFLQENLLRFKYLNSKFKDMENALLPKPSVAEQLPKLTKKQIRELREQLMVMNEQKFIIENLINDVTKQRKFDELQPLIKNKQELLTEIEKLEAQLGEFGF